MAPSISLMNKQVTPLAPTASPGRGPEAAPLSGNQSVSCPLPAASSISKPGEQLGPDVVCFRACPVQLSCCGRQDEAPVPRWPGKASPSITLLGPPGPIQQAPQLPAGAVARIT